MYVSALDKFYTQRPEFAQLKESKKRSARERPPADVPLAPGRFPV